MLTDVQRKIAASQEGRRAAPSLTMDANDSGEDADEADSLISPITEFATQGVRRIHNGTVHKWTINKVVRPAGGGIPLLTLCCYAFCSP